MSIQRVAIIFDNTARPETTGLYCRRALGELVEVEHFLPAEVPQIPVELFDLFLCVDDGLDYSLPDSLHPSVYWAIDTHLNFDRSLNRARSFDLVYAAQRDGAERLRQAGISSATWLPLACDPKLHGKQDVKKTIDVAFVGHLFPGARQELLEKIQQCFRNTFCGNRYFEEMARTYSESRIVFNRSIRNDINMRVFEGLASGSLLLTNDLSDNGQSELFRDGVHLASYRSGEELIDKVEWYLAHEEAREQIANAGYEEVLANHTYLHRMKRMLADVAKTSTSSSQPVIDDVIETGDHAVNRPEKDGVYFDFPRPDVLALVPASSGRVLDIGCGAGRLGLSIKERQAAHVTGIELNPTAASIAHQRLDEVLVGNIEEGEIDFSPGSFDCVICADVLEHMEQPELVLEKINFWLTPNGRLIASIPNVQHHSVIRALIDGNFTYEAAGLLDEDHVRFFTWQSIEALFKQNGFEIQDVRRVCLDGYQQWSQQGRPAELRAGKLHIAGTSSDEIEQFYVYQYLVTAGPSTIPHVATEKHDSSEDPDGDLHRSKEQFAIGLIPRDAKRIFHVHCGDGTLGARLEKRNAAQVVGMEHNPTLRALAAEKLDGHVEANLETVLQKYGEVSFDAIIVSQLERERHPLRLLQRLKSLLSPAGALVVTLPSLRTRSTVASLLDGCWMPEFANSDRVIALRFFTRREMEKLLFRAGFQVTSRKTIPGNGYQSWSRSDSPGEVNLNRLTVIGLKQGDAEEFFSDGFALQAACHTNKYTKLTSIVIPVFNQLSYTRQCLDSIRLRTDEPYELIVIDNGSTDGTAEYLQSLDDVRIVTNSENRGFPAAVNQGIEVAKGEHILLLNNDVIVTTSWLSRMLDAFAVDPKIGLVGPYSNNISGYQQIEVSYDELAQLDGFAWARQSPEEPVSAGTTPLREVDRLIGFCLLIRREVIEEVGLLDEQFGMGCFEDDDFCRRAIAAGYRAVIAEKSFIHHFGSQTFQASGVDFGELMRVNKQKFAKKWGQKQQVALARSTGEQRSPRPPFKAVRAEGGGLLLKPNDVRLSLCMIVRDNEQTIRPCLESIKPWVDEMVVVDTGSTDSTPEICSALGARLFEFPWCDDFAAARNESIRHARGEWIFWMDSDDTIPQECGEKLRELADRDHDRNMYGYVMQVHCPGPSQNGSDEVTVVDHVKLIRNQPDIYFEGRIHEQVIPSIRAAGGNVAFTDVHVVHSGSDHSEAGRQRKLERDFRLLKLELQEKPDHPFVLFNLGMTHADAREYEAAIGYLQRCIEVSRPEESHVRKAYALLVSAYAQSEQYEPAWETCRDGLELFPDDVELRFRSGLLHHHFGRMEQASQAYLKVLRDPGERHFASVDHGIGGFKARHNLAIVYEDMGKLDEAEIQWRTITNERPEYRPAWRGLGEILLKQNKLTEARAVADGLMSKPEQRSEGHILSARVSELRGDIEAAHLELETACKKSPDDLESLRELCRLLFENGQMEAAKTFLERLVKRQPNDAAAFHNLGVACINTNELGGAIDSLRHSLSIRSSHVPTMFMLGHALAHANQHKQAIITLKDVLFVEPKHDEAKRMLVELQELDIVL